MHRIVSTQSTNLADASDEQLAATAQAGSPAAFEAIVRRYQVPLMRYLLRRTSSRADAEDVLQETFVRAYEHLNTFRPGARLKPWLYAVARNAAVAHGRRPRLVAEPHDGPVASGDDRLEGEETRDRLWAVARSLLSADQYDVLWLHYVEDLPTPEVARVMGRSWVSVKTLLVRARRRLAPHAARVYGLQARTATGVS